MELHSIIHLLHKYLSKTDILLNQPIHPEASGNAKRIKEIFDAKPESEDELNDLIFKDRSRANAYRLKAELKEKLLSSLFFIDFGNNKLDAVQAVQVSCSLKLSQAEILIKFGLRNNAIDLLQEVIKEAEYFHFTKILINAYALLKKRMSLLGDVRKFDEYHSLWTKLKDIDKAEDEVVFLESVFKLKGQLSVRRILSDINSQQNALQRVKVLKEKYNTPIINQKYFSMVNDYFLRTANWKESKKLAEDFLNHVDKSPREYLLIKRSLLNIMKAYSHLLLGEYHTGVKFIESVLEEYRGDETNYFILMEDYCIFGLRLGQYEQAVSIFLDVLNNPAFKNEPVFTKERWAIYQAYALFFAGKEDEIAVDFLNNFPEYSKDKEGFNLHLLFLQILILLKKNDEELLYARLENLRYYKIRQIDKSENVRAQYFMRLLGLLNTHACDYEKCLHKGKTYHQFLIDNPEGEQPYTEVELLSYEVIWQYILEMLKNNSARLLPNSKSKSDSIKNR